jgi:uncharacterized protein DUF2171
MIVTNEADVREGMEVIGLDGVSVGTVGAVWIKERVESKAHDLAEGMPPLSGPGHDGHFLVRDQGKELYVPFDAIAILFPGQNLTLTCTAEECRNLYRSEPVSLATFQLVHAVTPN